ncbi:MAG: hypothetical protein HC888_00815 [Candidatus Competibacteraceae bacterium]|nr:hypothetical protein [Candidatus Competibacteraceae bacterium]
MIDEILSMLDNPRQAITNAARSAFGAEGTDLLSAAPGLLGALGAVGLGATGFGLPLALLGGSLLGGTAQGIGRSTGMEQFNAPTSEEVAKNLFGSDEFIPSLLAGALTDPLTYIGGIGGARAGAQAGAKIGSGLEKQALMRGPMYQGGAEDFYRAIDKADLKLNPAIEFGRGTHQFRRNYGNLSDETLNRILGEIPPQSEFLGSGAYGVAMKTPTGDVLRVAPVEQFEKMSGVGIGRPNVDSVLGTTRSIDFVDPVVPSGAIRVERMPMAEMKDQAYWVNRKKVPDPTSSYGARLESEKEALMRRAESQGLNPWDNHSGNMGIVGGQSKYIDPGSYQWSPKHIPYQESLVYKKPGAAQEMIHKILGSKQRVRNNLETGQSVGIEDLIRKMGGGLGGAGGAAIPTAARSVYE